MLLAESQDYVKLIGGAIFAIIWVVVSILGGLAKKREQEEARRRMEEVPSADTSGPPVLPPPIPSLPDGGDVRTREEMERRIEQARARRQASTYGRGPAPRDLETARSGDQSVPTGPRPRDIQSTRSGPASTESMTSRTGDRDFRPGQPSDLDSVLAAQRAEADRLRRERDAARRRSIEAEDNALREKIRRQKKPKSRPPVSTTPISPAHLHAPSDDTVHATVATEALKSSNLSPTANQRPQVADAATIHRWLTPATLKQQYILTELLSPPVALRPNHLQ